MSDDFEIGLPGFKQRGTMSELFQLDVQRAAELGSAISLWNFTQTSPWGLHK